MWDQTNPIYKLHSLSEDNRVLVGYDPRTYDAKEASLTHMPALAREFMFKLHRRRPDWKFVVSKYNDYGGHQLQHITVLQDGEVVGVCWQTTHGSSSAIAVCNPRIAAEYPRRGHQVTSKVEVATRIVAKFFTPMTDGERLTALVNKHSGTASSLFNETVNKLTRAYSFNVAHKILPLILPRLDEFSDQLVAAGVSEDTIKSLPTLYTNSKFAEALIDNRAMVTYSEGHYFVAAVLKRGARGYYKVPQSDLPGDFARKMGLLKLVPERTLLEGAGINLGSNIYSLSVEDNSFKELAAYAVG
jgi:hypothetical protein